jgi:hypothetical protein
MWSERLRLERRASRQGTEATVACAEAAMRLNAADQTDDDGLESSATHARSPVRSRPTERLTRAAQRSA